MGRGQPTTLEKYLSVRWTEAVEMLGQQSWDATRLESWFAGSVVRILIRRAVLRAEDQEAFQSL